MNSYNPFQMLMTMMGNSRQIPFMPTSGMGTSQSQNRIPINQQQFKHFLSKIDTNILQQLVQQARAQGIPDNEIEAGINFLNQLK